MRKREGGREKRGGREETHLITPHKPTKILHSREQHLLRLQLLILLLVFLPSSCVKAVCAPPSSGADLYSHQRSRPLKMKVEGKKER
jgi:hypothetical protein